MKSLNLFLIVFLLLFTYCSDNNSNSNIPNRGKFVNISQSQELDTSWFHTEIMKIDHSDPVFISYKDAIDVIKTKKAKLFVPLFAQFEYKSLNNKKQETTLSGLVLFPFTLKKEEISSIPVICLTHGTQILRKHAPSNFNLNLEDFPEVAIGLIIAATGYVVVMPDYQGMGKDDSEFHPFCIGELLGIASADMIAAIRDFAASNEVPFGLNNQNFFMGYSEGGYATLAAVREFEKSYPKLELTGAVPMEGPYDLSGTMAGVMVADTAFPEPYFLPYVIRGYQEIYPSIFSWENVLNEEFLSKIPPVLDGYHNGKAINQVMPQDRVLKKIFSNDFIANLQNQNSDVFKNLDANNLNKGWAPRTKVHLIHCTKDDCVPYNNTLVTYNFFRDVMKLSNVTKFEPELYIPLGEIVHVNAAPGCFLYGYLWILEHSN